MLAPLVSVVVPCFNAADTIGAAIESALAQTHGNVEAIVVDDGSSDASLQVLESFATRVTLLRQSNAGACAARNTGLEAASGRFVKFLDADDRLLPRCIERQVAEAQRFGPEERISVFGDPVWVDADGAPIEMDPSETRLQPGEEPTLAWMIEHAPLTSCPLHRREDLITVGGFDQRVPRAQENDLHVRMLLSGVRFVYFPGDCYYYHQHGSNVRISGESYGRVGPGMLQAIERQMVLAKSFRRGSLRAEDRRAFARRIWRIGRGALRAGADDVAAKCFRRAREIDADGAICGRRSYRQVCRLFGPRLAEQVSAIAHTGSRRLARPLGRVWSR